MPPTQRRSEGSIRWSLNRAATALIQCRSHLEKAHELMREAIEVLASVEAPPAPGNGAVRESDLALLRKLLVRIREAHSNLGGVVAKDAGVGDSVERTAPPTGPPASMSA